MNQEIDITAIVYGETTINGKMAFVGGSEKDIYPIKLVLYVVRTAQKWILIDAGCDTMPGFELHNFVSPAVALERAGIEPTQITDVIITHAHHDHVDGVRHFPNAVIYIQQEEYIVAKRYIPNGFSVRTFEDSCTVADCLKICKIGGHSSGSCIVTAEQEETTYVFAGDECYLPLCLERKIPTGASYKPERSRAFVETYSSPQYTVLLGHDPLAVTGSVQCVHEACTKPYRRQAEIKSERTMLL